MASQARAPFGQTSNLDSDILELKVEVEQFTKETEKIHNDFVDTVNNINSEFRSVDSIFSKHRRLKKVYVELETQLRELKKELGDLNELNALESSLQEIKAIVDDLGKSKRKTGSHFVSLLMGKVSVRIWNKGDRYKFKTEYNRFKERWMSIFFIFPAIQILFGFSQMINQIQALLFFFYYGSLAIRENILSLNGSRIEAWWIYHHYWSIAIALLTLIIYSDDALVSSDNSIIYLNYFFFYQGLVMLLQNDYQKNRHYARKALAKKSQLDPTTSEVIDETPHAKYKLLLPALYATYCAQLCISIYFLFLSSYNALSQLKSIQIIAMAICWFVLSIGNASTLSKVLKKKKLRLKAMHQKKAKRSNKKSD
eukprot:298572_1